MAGFLHVEEGFERNILKMPPRRERMTDSFHVAEEERDVQSRGSAEAAEAGREKGYKGRYWNSLRQRAAMSETGVTVRPEVLASRRAKEDSLLNDEM